MNNAFIRRRSRKDEQRFMKTGKHDHESPRELERQIEAQRMVAPKSGANVCRHKCNLKKSRLLIAQDTQQKLRVAFSYLERNYIATNEIPDHFILWIRIFPLSVIPLFPFSQINCLILTV